MGRSLKTAVVMARGMGTRMQRDDARAALDPRQSSAAGAGMKAMMPVSEGRPFLDYVLSALAAADYETAVIVVAPDHAVIRRHYDELAPTRVAIRYAVQQDPSGTANAVAAAEHVVRESLAGGDTRGADPADFLVINGDNYYPAAVLRAAREIGEPGTVLFEREALIRGSNIPLERVKSYAYAEVGHDGYLRDIVEKPDEEQEKRFERDPLVSMTCWRFSSEVFEACRMVERSPRGEYELTGAVRLAVRSGMKLKCARSRDGVLDLSTRADVAEVMSRLSAVKVAL